MVNSPMTMAKVRKAPLRTRDPDVGQDDPEQDGRPAGAEALAASVSVRTSMARRPVSTARYM